MIIYKIIPGMVAACAVKSAQTVNKMRALVEEGITEKDWTEKLVKSTFEVANPDKPNNATRQRRRLLF